MTKRTWFMIILVLSVLTVGGILFHLASAVSLPVPDLSAINRIRKDTADSFETGSFSMLKDCPYDYTVIGTDETLFYQSDETLPSTVHDAVRAHFTVLPVEKEGRVLGLVLIDTRYERQIGEVRQQLILWAVLFLTFTICFILGCTWYLHISILKPFTRLKGFARHVASGNLDLPLPMDRGHNFGAFTESFDLMRDQIREARQKEAKANQSKKELTASLSHDIKTPVTSIKLVSELLLATEPEGRTKDKIRTIYQKAEQIDLLVSNLLQASLEDLGELTIRMAEESSTILSDYIRDADCFGSITCTPVPGCIIRTDRQRLSQVLDNLLYNSCKYAGTSILIDYRLSDDTLTVVCRDYGKGVPEEELPFLFHKYYRGSNSQSSQADGSGLGLFISRYLMEEMGGGITCYNLADGFCAELVIPLVTPG